MLDSIVFVCFSLMKMQRFLKGQLICIICPPLVLCISLHKMFVLMLTTSRPGVERYSGKVKRRSTTVTAKKADNLTYVARVLTIFEELGTFFCNVLSISTSKSETFVRMK